MVKQSKGIKRRVSTSKRKRNFASFLPFLLLCLILFCLGFICVVVYKHVTESSFFKVDSIEIKGANQVSREDIERIVRIETAGKNVWNADINVIKEKIESIPLVKEAVVSKVLPNTIKVVVTERTPQLVAQVDSGFFWIDDEAKILKRSKQGETNWFLVGLDQGKNEKANKENQERAKMAIKIKEELEKIGANDKIKVLDLSNLSAPKLLVDDSNETVAIFLNKDDFAKSILKALEVLKGRGKEIEAVILQKDDIIIRFRHL